MANGHGMYTGIEEAPANEIESSDIQYLKDNGVPSIETYNKNREVNQIKEIMGMIRKEAIVTIDDLETYVYGGSLFKKTLTTGSTNVIQSMYGRRAWDQVNREHTLFALLRKVAWSTSGWRVITPEDNDNPDYSLFHDLCIFNLRVPVPFITRCHSCLFINIDSFKEVGNRLSNCTCQSVSPSISTVLSSSSLCHSNSIGSMLSSNSLTV